MASLHGGIPTKPQLSFPRLSCRDKYLKAATFLDNKIIIKFILETTF